MTVTLTVLGVAAAVVIGSMVVSYRNELPADPDGRSRWRRWLDERSDGTTVGGATLTIGFLAVFIAALIVGFLFDALEDEGVLADLDVRVAEFVAEHTTDTVTSVFDVVTELGGTSVAVAAAVVVAVYGWWRHRNVQVALFMTAVVIGQSLINNGLKMLIDRERPDVLQLVGWAGASFPSGHSATAASIWAAIALVLAIGRSRRTQVALGVAAVVIAVLVGISRPLLGVHWFSDVIAGLAVGWAWFVVCALAFGFTRMRFGAAFRTEDSLDAEEATT